MNEECLWGSLVALGDASAALTWRRGKCIEQWAVDDCGCCPAQTSETPPQWRTHILTVDSYLEIVREAIPCWRFARAEFGDDHAEVLAAGLLDELRAMTEDESSEPNARRWVAPSLDSRSCSHIGHLVGKGDQIGWAFMCDCSAQRRHYSDRVRGGLLPCPVCLAHLSADLQVPRFRETSERLLQKIGWKLGNPPPIIWRTQETPTSWVTARDRYPNWKRLQDLMPEYGKISRNGA